MSKATTARATWKRRLRVPAMIYLVTLAGYLAASGSRLAKPTQDSHYVYLAQSLLQGRLSLASAPPHGNDWSLVEEITLTDGRNVRGAFLKTVGGPHRFKTTRGERMVIPPEEIRTRRRVYYVSFPWLPALLMMPFVALWGLAFNDVLFNVLLGALNPVLLFLVLRRLSERGYSGRTLTENLWLTGMFAFGTVLFYSSVIGQTWYTAHVIGVGLTALYAFAALEARHPVAAGSCLGLGFVTRTPIPFTFPFLVGEVLRRNLRPASEEETQSSHSSFWSRARAAAVRIRWARSVRILALAAAPAIAVAIVAFILNTVRFDSPFEFGHYYLNVRWTDRIQRWGLFNYHFLSRNLAAMLTLLPRILARPPYVKVSHHGLSVFFTTPIFSYLLWPQRRSSLQPWLYLSCLFPMILHLLYQHTGWLQFGYRFSLDYTVFAVMLLAVGGYRLGNRAKALILFGVGVNTFGALTFYRTMGTFYFDDMFPV